MNRYVHEKFGFVHTSGIEITWNIMKKASMGLRYNSCPNIINEYANAYTFKTIFRKDGLRNMVMKCLRFYYDHKYKKLLELCEFEEYPCPSLIRMEEYIREMEGDNKQRNLQMMKHYRLNKRD